ncbi:MAG: DNA-binding protein [Desulfurellales bacterium]|nr:MAG: DNA-binding protein [Desulfurellales bacterium]
MSEFLTTKEIKALLKVSHNTLKKLMKEGLPHLQLGREFRFPRQRVEQWLNNRVTPKK